MKKFEQNKELKNLCTIGVGGPAKFYLEVHSILKMMHSLKDCKNENLNFFILGKGSNILFDDSGFNGLVIHNKIDFIKEISPNLFYVGAGFSFSRLGVLLSKMSLSGLEFASGIPASVGGAVYMNAGANAQQTSDCLIEVEFVDLDGNLKKFKRSDLEYSYRYSSFQDMLGAIVSATFSLKPCKDAGKNQQNFIQKRIKSQPYREKSAGCMFRNPSQFKAGALIEKCGLKSLQIGGAQVSSIHSNFIINTGTATSKDVLALIKKIKQTVKEKKGIDLQTEVKYIPYEL